MDTQKTGQNFNTRYTLRLATQEDLPRIIALLQSDTRPATVFERTEEALSRAVNNDLMWLLTDDTDKINTMAAVHLIPVKAPIGSTVNKGVMRHASVMLNFAEIGTIWRPQKPPSGFCLDLVYSACILQTYVRARDLSISTLVTQIVASNERGRENLAGLNQGWDSFLPERSFSSMFQSTITDQESRDIELASFYTPASVALLGAAKCLLGKNEPQKFWPSEDAPNLIRAKDYTYGSNIFVDIDLSQTELMPLARNIIKIDGENSLDKILDTSDPWLAARNKLLPGKNALTSAESNDSCNRPLIRRGSSLMALQS